MFIILLIRGAQGPIRGAPTGGQRAEGGGRMMKGKGGRRTADEEKFLLPFSNTQYFNSFTYSTGIILFSVDVYTFLM